MNTPFDTTGPDGRKIVYVRPIQVKDLPDEVRKQVHGVAEIYAVHNSSGERLALVRDRRTAFYRARQNDLAPVSVH